MWFATGRMWMTTAHSAFWKSAFRLVIIELLVISSQNFQRNIEVYLKTKYCFILRQRAEKCQMDGWWFVLFHGIAPKLAHFGAIWHIQQYTFSPDHHLYQTTMMLTKTVEWALQNYIYDDDCDSDGKCISRDSRQKIWDKIHRREREMS